MHSDQDTPTPPPSSPIYRGGWQVVVIGGYLLLVAELQSFAVDASG